MSKDPYRYFRIEARDLLDQMGQGVLDLEKSPGDTRSIARLLRLAHTLKGAARVVKQKQIADQAHAVEDLLMPLHDLPPAEALAPIDQLLGLLDVANACLSGLAVPQSASSVSDSALAEPARLVRADMIEVDALLRSIGQAHTHIAPLRRGVSAAAQARALADDLLEQLKAGARAADPASRQAHAVAEQLHDLLGGFERGAEAAVDQIERELRQVRDTAEQLRLVPVATLFTALDRTVRDAAKALGKQAVFEGHGGALGLDADALSALQGALLQLARNAVAHGIESAAQRVVAGKPPVGKVVLDVSRRGGQLVFRCGDDGAGVDVAALRRAAPDSAGDAPLSQAAVLALMMRGGVSTATEVTALAGRGVGLDLVRDTVDRLGGAINLSFQPGLGTTFEISVPLSIAALDVLLVEAGGQVLSIPLSAVQRTLRYRADQIARTGNTEAIIDQGSAIPYRRLTRLLGGVETPSAARQPAHGSAVIVRGAHGVAAIGVDRLRGTAHVVLRALPELTPASAIIAAASLDMEGKPQLALDAEALVAAVNQTLDTLADPASDDTGCAPVLVVDDSLTTRMLEQSILESAGYTVHAAVSAEEGLARARQQRYSLFLVDVDMPGMDGFSFVEQTRADPVMRETPAILVTSRSSLADKQRGELVGASGYIVKSEFAQADFLRQVRELVKAP